METKLVECSKIDVPKTSNDLRTFSKEFAIKLADSIRAEGMYLPIVVRPNPDQPGRYILVQGKHRFYATKTVLKVSLIETKIIDDMDDAEAEMALIAENLWRNPLTKAQHTICIQKWFEHFMAKNPEKVGRGKAGLASANKDKDKSAEESNSESEAKDSEEKSETNFAKTVAAATGQSEASAKRTQKVATSFSRDQLEVFDQMSVGQGDMYTIAKIKDETKRGEVVNLIASGMEVEDALKEVMGSEAPKKDNGLSKAESEAKETAKEEKKAELTDDEWFDATCGEKAAMLGDPARFKADALMYRKILDARHTFRAKVKSTVKATAEAGTKGLFWFAVNRLISFSHPKDWTLCPDCKGQGVTNMKGDTATLDRKCSKCGGGGYQMKIEEYL